MLIFVLLGVLLAYVVLISLRPPDRVRGPILAAVTLALTIGWSPTAPAEVREAVIWGSVLALGLGCVSKRTRTTRASNVVPVVAILLFAVTLLVTWIVMPDGAPALLRIGALAAGAVIVASQCSLSDRSTALTGVLLAALVQATLGVAEFVFALPPALWGYGVRVDGTSAIYLNPLIDGAVRVQGTAGHPIPFATIVGVGVVVLVARWRKTPKWVAVPLSILFAGALLLSGTRSVMVALLVGLCYLLLLSGHSVHKVRNYSLAVAITVLAVLFDNGIRTGVDELVDSGSFENRASAIESVPGLLSRPLGAVLFGSGWGSESSLFASGYLQQNGFNVVDNQFVTTIATQGLIGLLFLLGLYVVAFIRADATTRSMLLVFFVMGFSFDYLRWPPIVFLLFAVFGLAASSTREPVADLKGPVSFPQRARS